MQTGAAGHIGTEKSLNHSRLPKVKEWPCGHARTPENTQGIGCAGVRCKTCRQRITQASYHRNKCADPDTRRLQYRVNYLPFQIHSAREKLARLEAEALRLGLRDLVGQRA